MSRKGITETLIVTKLVTAIKKDIANGFAIDVKKKVPFGAEVSKVISELADVISKDPQIQEGS